MTEFIDTRCKVANRGRPPVSFLEELLAWGTVTDDEIFARNDNPSDVYSYIKATLGPWESELHRRAALLETMRVHAGLESDWHQYEGVDVTNPASVANPEMEETGLFQVSFDSTEIHNQAMKPFAIAHGISTPETFIPAMKANVALAFEYYARLVRVSVWWAGPFRRGEVQDWLSRRAMKEFMAFLAPPIEVGIETT